MQIRSNYLTEENKAKFGSTASTASAFSRFEASAPNLNVSGSIPALTPKPETAAIIAKPPTPQQNRYETIFIKLFAQTTIKLILSFAAVLLSLVVVRDLIGFKINIFKISFWFQFSLNLILFVGLIFAKLKSISSIVNFYIFSDLPILDSTSSSIVNPFEKYFNQDQIILIGVWIAAAFNFGSWYFRQYANTLYRLFDHVKGKQDPSLREEYFLVWATLLSHGLVSWLSGIYFASPGSFGPKSTDKIGLSHYLHCRIQQVSFWPMLLKRSAVIFASLIFIHLFVAWMGFPLFGMFISCLIDLHQPVKHSWTSVFRFGIIMHLLTFSLFSNLIFALIDWLIEFYMNKTFKTSTFVPDSEKCLTVGLCHTKQPFIHLQACNEFYDICSDSDDNSMASFSRMKLYSAVEDEGSLSREICDWFASEMVQVKERCELSLKELILLQKSLKLDRREDVIGESPEVFKMYSEKTSSLIELVLKRVFANSKATTPNPSVINATAQVSGIPDIFARRGGSVKGFGDNSSLLRSDSSGVPLIYEFGPFLFKNSLGRALISQWVSSRKLYPLERFETLDICIRAMGSFIRASYDEDERGHVQICLPKTLEAMIEAYEGLQDLLKFELSSLVIVSEADEQIDSISCLIRCELQGIRDTFGESLEELRLSEKCLMFLSNL